MDPKKLEALLAKLPKEQRFSARNRILHYSKAGWTHIGLWEFDARYPTHEFDLVGWDAKGKFDFIPRLTGNEANAMG